MSQRNRIAACKWKCIILSVNDVLVCETSPDVWNATILPIDLLTSMTATFARLLLERLLVSCMTASCSGTTDQLVDPTIRAIASSLRHSSGVGKSVSYR